MRMIPKKVNIKSNTHTESVKEHTLQLHITLDCPQM